MMTFRALALVVCPMVLRAYINANEAPSLALTASCSLGGKYVQCAAAQWGNNKGPNKLHATGAIVSISIADGCDADAGSRTPHLGRFQSTASSDPSQRRLHAAASSHQPAGEAVAITPRGDCSFATKALNIQRQGFTGLIIVDSSSNEPPMPPGLGDNDVSIPVAMVSTVDELFIPRSEHLQASIKLQATDEASLWLGSPWYESAKSGISLS